jgi:hypothetical protein
MTRPPDFIRAILNSARPLMTFGTPFSVFYSASATGSRSVLVCLTSTQGYSTHRSSFY